MHVCDLFRWSTGNTETITAVFAVLVVFVILVLIASFLMWRRVKALKLDPKQYGHTSATTDGIEVRRVMWFAVRAFEILLLCTVDSKSRPTPAGKCDVSRLVVVYVRVGGLATHERTYIRDICLRVQMSDHGLGEAGSDTDDGSGGMGPGVRGWTRPI